MFIKTIAYFKFNVHGSVHRKNTLIYIQLQLYTVYCIWKLLYMFWVVPPPIIRSANNSIHSICYLWRSWNCSAVPTPPRQRQVAVTVWQIPNAVDIVVCAPDDGWRYYPKHAEQFTDINKLCNVASCWIYSRIFRTFFFLWQTISLSWNCSHQKIIAILTSQFSFWPYKETKGLNLQSLEYYDRLVRSAIS